MGASAPRPGWLPHVGLAVLICPSVRESKMAAFGGGTPARQQGLRRASPSLFFIYFFCRRFRELPREVHESQAEDQESEFPFFAWPEAASRSGMTTGDGASCVRMRGRERAFSQQHHPLIGWCEGFVD